MYVRDYDASLVTWSKYMDATVTATTVTTTSESSSMLEQEGVTEIQWRSPLCYLSWRPSSSSVVQGSEYELHLFRRDVLAMNLRTRHSFYSFPFLIEGERYTVGIQPLDQKGNPIGPMNRSPVLWAPPSVLGSLLATGTLAQSDWMGFTTEDQGEAIRCGTYLIHDLLRRFLSEGMEESLLFSWSYHLALAWKWIRPESPCHSWISFQSPRGSLSYAESLLWLVLVSEEWERRHRATTGSSLLRDSIRSHLQKKGAWDAFWSRTLPPFPSPSVVLNVSFNGSFEPPVSLSSMTDDRASQWKSDDHPLLFSVWMWSEYTRISGSSISQQIYSLLDLMHSVHAVKNHGSSAYLPLLFSFVFQKWFGNEIPFLWSDYQFMNEIWSTYSVESMEQNAFGIFSRSRITWNHWSEWADNLCAVHLYYDPSEENQRRYMESRVFFNEWFLAHRGCLSTGPVSEGPIVQPKVEPVVQPKVEEPKEEQPKVEPVVQPKEEQPKEEQPKEEQPKEEQPKEEQPKEEQPKKEQPKVEEPYVIKVNYVSITPSTYIQSLIQQVIDILQSVIIASPGLRLPEVDLTADMVVDLDFQALSLNLLASSTPTVVNSSVTPAIPLRQRVTINMNQLLSMISKQVRLNDQSVPHFVPILLHEMLHGFGLASIFDGQQHIGWDALLDETRTWYIGPTGKPSAAIAAYQTLMGRTDLHRIPVENSFGAGTAYSHWEEGVAEGFVSEQRIYQNVVYPGLSNEIMSGIAGTQYDFTMITAGALMDYGYSINRSSPYLMM